VLVLYKIAQIIASEQASAKSRKKKHIWVSLAAQEQPRNRKRPKPDDKNADRVMKAPDERPDIPP